MMRLAAVPRAKNVIPGDLPVNMSCQRIYEHEKSHGSRRGFCVLSLYFQCSEFGGSIWQDSARVPEMGLAVRAALCRDFLSAPPTASMEQLCFRKVGLPIRKESGEDE
jgi:hypothetical protein